METLNSFLLGAFTLACAAIALFFFQYWRRSRDRLFLVFSFAFVLFTVERIVLAFVSADQEGRHWIFLARLCAFILISVGIIDKNRPHRRASDDRRAAP
jgi:hypothetical protein